MGGERAGGEMKGAGEKRERRERGKERGREREGERESRRGERERARANVCEREEVCV